MRHAVLALLVSLAFALPARAEPAPLSQQTAFTIGPWTGMRYIAGDSALVSCGLAGSASARDGIAINLGRAGGLVISASREGWKFRPGSTEVEFLIDGVTIATTADASDSNVLRVAFGTPEDRAVYERLETGRLLEIRTRKGNQSYDLTGLDQAMPALRGCVTGEADNTRRAAERSAAPVPSGAVPATPFDVPGATRLEKSEVMAVMANTVLRNDEAKPTFLLAKELATVLPGYDVGWRDDTGVLVGTAVRGHVGDAGVATIIGNLLGVETAHCTGKMAIEIRQSPSDRGYAKHIDAYCDGGGNGKQTHFLVYAFDNGGTMITRFEPVSMKDPKTLVGEIYED